MRKRPSYKHAARYAISRWMGWMVIEVQLNVQWTISTLSHFFQFFNILFKQNWKGLGKKQFSFSGVLSKNFFTRFQYNPNWGRGSPTSPTQVHSVSVRFVFHFSSKILFSVVLPWPSASATCVAMPAFWEHWSPNPSLKRNGFYIIWYFHSYTPAPGVQLESWILSGSLLWFDWIHPERLLWQFRGRVKKANVLESRQWLTWSYLP